MKKLAIPLTILLLPFLYLVLCAMLENNYANLGYEGPREAVMTIVDGKEVWDTVYHKIPDFSFTDQDGNTFSSENVEGKIFVADFFFTSCPTICPDMAANLKRVQWKTKDFGDVMILSHTVNPERDTAEVLKTYSMKYEANNEKWVFLTGEKAEIYELAAKGYLLVAGEDYKAPGGFIHTNLFALIDKEKHIRGFYDGTSVAEVDKLIEEITVLKREYLLKQK